MDTATGSGWRSDLRVSDAERDRVVAALKRHTTEGRLTLDEFEERVGEVYAARTGGELVHTLRELPASGAALPRAPAPRPARARATTAAPSPSPRPSPPRRPPGVPSPLLVAGVLLLVFAATGPWVVAFWPVVLVAVLVAVGSRGGRASCGWPAQRPASRRAGGLPAPPGHERL